MASITSLCWQTCEYSCRRNCAVDSEKCCLQQSLMVLLSGQIVLATVSNSAIPSTVESGDLNQSKQEWPWLLLPRSSGSPVNDTGGP